MKTSNPSFKRTRLACYSAYFTMSSIFRSEERRVGKECYS